MLNKTETNLNNKILKNGYIIKKCNRKLLGNLRNIVTDVIKSKLKLTTRSNKEILDNIHKYVKVSKLNNFRMSIYNEINKNKKFKELYFLLFKKYLYSIVGNELVMQKRINLSIQYPNDNSSLLPVHSDTWSGVSPYEIVAWLPLVDCYKTKSMYILNPENSMKLNQNFKNFKNKNSEDIFESIKKNIIWLDVKYGEILLFNQNLPHGNRVNEETGTRWSFNCRFKNIFTPYYDKKIGEFYEPITLRATSLIGMNYKFPEI